jgi:hypothetical protein
MGSVTLNGATSGQITLQPTDVAGTNTVTVAAQTGTLNVAGPAFSAYASSSQTVTTGTVTKVAIDTENFDTNSNFNTTNNRFTPTVEGYYQVNGIVAAQGATTITTVLAFLYKNGSAYRRTGLSSSFTTATPIQINLSEVVYMNGSTDYLELYGQVNGTGTLQFIQTSAVTTSVFSACLVRGA